MSEIIWKPVLGFDGYLVSNTGLVKSLKRGGEKVLKTHLYDGYEKVKLCNGMGGETTITVHRLVAIKFVDNPFKFPQVDHIDGNKRNNNASNLEWVTKQENHDRARKLGLLKSPLGQNQGASKLRDIDIPIIREACSLFGKGSQSKVAKYYGVSVYAINKIVLGINWKHL